MVDNGGKAVRKPAPANAPASRKQSLPGDVGGMVESIVGCKWSLHVLAQVRRGVNRPGAMARSAKGLTTKVLNERLSKMVRFGILERIAYPEVPPRVEYRLTDFGGRFTALLDQIEALQRELEVSRRE